MNRHGAARKSPTDLAGDDMSTIDKAVFRSALGRFATGVTVITTRDGQGSPVGVTANSFNSVSLEPPMVLWSLAKTSRSMKSFSEAEFFAVHVLASDQQALSNRFAARDTEKFRDVDYQDEAAPLLNGCAAIFMCRTIYQYEGGDHIIFVGEVTQFRADEKPPLLYLGGRYAEARRGPGKPVEAIDLERCRVGAQSIIHLLAYTHNLLKRQIVQAIAEFGMTQEHLAILIAISQLENPQWDEVRRRVEANDFSVEARAVQTLLELGWVSSDARGMALTDGGRDVFVKALSRLKAIEESFCDGLSDGELSEARHALSSIIAKQSGSLLSLIH